MNVTINFDSVCGGGNHYTFNINWGVKGSAKVTYSRRDILGDLPEDKLREMLNYSIRFLIRNSTANNVQELKQEMTNKEISI